MMSYAEALQFHRDKLARDWAFYRKGLDPSAELEPLGEWLQRTVGVSHPRFLTDLAVALKARELMSLVVNRAIDGDDPEWCFKRYREDRPPTPRAPSYPTTFGELERAAGVTLEDWQRMGVLTMWPHGFNPCPPDDGEEYNWGDEPPPLMGA